MGYFIWPVPNFGRVTSKYRTAERPIHNGIDIGRNIDPPQPIDGAPAVAIASGTVAAAGTGHESMGTWLTIDHGGGWQTRYMHNAKNIAAAGQTVERGETVALVGNTGRSTAPHLHFELIKDGSHVNPLDYLRPWRQNEEPAVCPDAVSDASLDAKPSCPDAKPTMPPDGQLMLTNNSKAVQQLFVRLRQLFDWRYTV